MFVPGIGFTYDELIDRIPEKDIYEKYLSQCIIGKKFMSPFREEGIPSANLYVGDKGNIMYNDLGEDEKAMNCVGLVSKLYNITFYEALEKIARDFNVSRNTESKGYLRDIMKRSMEKPDTIIRVTYREWNEDDRKYWYDKYHINLSTLRLFHIRPISAFWINNWYNKAEPLSYCYHYFQDYDSRWLVKIYQPLTSDPFKKWFGNTGGKQIVQGEGVLPNSGDLLLITKSLKDVCLLYEYNLTAIAPASENSFLNEKYFNKQKERFKKIVIFYDNDAAGMKMATNFSKRYDIPYIHIPFTYTGEDQVKDITDFVAERGFDMGRFLMKELLKQVDYDYI